MLSLLALARPSAAQFETASVVGTVKDASGAVIADAKVTLTGLDTGVAQTRVADAAGAFEFFNVRIGTYAVTSEKPGFPSPWSTASRSPSASAAASTS